MPQSKISFERVRAAALGLPGVEEGTAYGAPALKVRGTMFACMASHRSAEPNTLVVRLPFDERDELVAAEPSIYYLKDHYVPYPCVLVRLNRVAEDALHELVMMGYQFVAADRRKPSPRRVKRR